MKSSASERGSCLLNHMNQFNVLLLVTKLVCWSVAVETIFRITILVHPGLCEQYSNAFPRRYIVALRQYWWFMYMVVLANPERKAEYRCQLLHCPQWYGCIVAIKHLSPQEIVFQGFWHGLTTLLMGMRCLYCFIWGMKLQYKGQINKSFW